MPELDDLRSQIMALDAKVSTLLEIIKDQKTRKDFYTIDEAAKLIGRAPYTVREWARLGRINAIKRNSGRGQYLDWVVSHEEISRIQSEGLLPWKSGPYAPQPRATGS